MKRIVLILSALMLFGLIYLCTAASDDSPVPGFGVVINAGGRTEQTDCWAGADGMYYIFIPSYAEMEDVYIAADSDDITVDGIALQDGMSAGCFETGREYVISFGSFGARMEGSLVFVQSANVYTMCIDTESGSMDYVHASRDNKEKGALRIYSADGALELECNLTAIKGRGNSTWETFEKKPYNIKLETAADIMGMGAAEEWILLANAADPSGMKNKIVYDFAAAAGLMYSPDSQWADLYINGEYMGLYLICERNELHTERVDISPEGSFLVSVELKDRMTDSDYVTTELGQTLRIRYPETVSTETKDWILGIWQPVENALVAENGIDPETGMHWTQLVDVDSWVRKYLIEEVFANGDACYISQYFYYEAGEENPVIYAGPVWDYDYSIDFFLSEYNGIASGFIANRRYVRNGYETPWFSSLYGSEEFYAEVVSVYERDFVPLLDELTESGIDEYADHIDAAYEMNAIRWNAGDADLDYQVQFIKTFVQRRTDFLDSAWIAGDEYVIIMVDVGHERNYSYIAVPYGETLPVLPDLESIGGTQFVGWFYADSNEPVDYDAPIYEDTAIYASWTGVSEQFVQRALKLMPLGVFMLALLVVMLIEFRRSILRRG